MIDDYRVIRIAEPSTCDHSTNASLVFWDTSVPQPRQLVFEMSSNELDVSYVPNRLMSSASTQGCMRLYRADPNNRIVRVFFEGSYGDVHDNYMLIVSTANLCGHASAQSAGELKIRWEKWKSSTTIVRIDLGITTVARISGPPVFRHS